MIKRLFVDNFKCMVNFEYKPASLHLLFGENGTGKTTTFEVLERLRDFVVSGTSTAKSFPADTLTAWQSRVEQTFELEIDGNGGRYSYRLLIEHDQPYNTNRVAKEELGFDGHMVYQFDGKNAHVFGNDFSAKGPFPHGGLQSGLGRLPPWVDNKWLSWFRWRMEHVYVFAIDPLRIENHSDTEDETPDRGLTNFASWYRHLAQESPEAIGALFDSLREVIDGFSGLKLSREGEKTRVLRVGFKGAHDQDNDADEFFLTIDELSEGQRCLIALFTILHYAVRSDTTVCIDEPDNFVALRELQPWLLELSDRIVKESGQCLLISHHPELINNLAVKHGIRFTRTELGPVRIKPFQWSKDDGVLPSEIVARGWDE